MTGENNTTMLVQPAYGGMGCGGYGNGWGGDWSSWIILFLIFGLFGGGWGNGFGGGFGGGAQQSYDTRADIQRGFDNSAVVGKLDGITQGICDSTYALSNTVTNGFHGVDSAICSLGYQTQNGFNQLGMNLMQGQNALSREVANCCCETREAIAGVNYNMATNTCAIQNTINNSTRDIIDAQNNGTRAILDRLVQDKIDAQNTKIAEQQSEIQSLRFAASQATQNATIGAMMDANTAEILRRTAPVPVPAYPVPNPNAAYCGNYGNFGGYGNNCSPCNSCCA